MKYIVMILLSPFILIGFVCAFIYFGIAIGIQLVGDMKSLLFRAFTLNDH